VRHGKPQSAVEPIHTDKRRHDASLSSNWVVSGGVNWRLNTVPMLPLMAGW